MELLRVKEWRKTKSGAWWGKHKGRYNPARDDEPYWLSRGRIENFIRSPARFWLEQARGVEFPGMPGFNLNTNTDTLLKRDHDQYRGKGPTPLMKKAGLKHLRPFAHEDIEKWEQSTQFGSSPKHFNTLHEKTNILFGGGLDDVWENIKTGELHIVDYKSTAQLSKLENIQPLDKNFLLPPKDPKKPDYKAGYRRQMDMYIWIMRRKGFQVSDIGYFLYVDGQHHGEKGMLDEKKVGQAWMKFNAAIIPYKADDSWVEKALIDAKKTLRRKTCPRFAKGDEYGIFYNDMKKALK